MPSTDGPHQDQPLLKGGTALDAASAALILLHGRGASAQGMLRLADELDVPDVAYLAPQAARRSWYPQSLMAALDENEPELTSALQVVSDLIQQAAAAGLGAERVAMLGFSQGACLATEYAARHPQRYGGVVGLSGGLIGPEDDPLAHEGSLEGTPVFLGCSDRDPYIPLARVQDTADVLAEMGATVTTQIYEGMGHTTNEEELRHTRELLSRHVDSASGSSGAAGDE
jgi:phospholipase/carboxylesterase